MNDIKKNINRKSNIRYSRKCKGVKPVEDGLKTRKPLQLIKDFVGGEKTNGRSKVSRQSPWRKKSWQLFCFPWKSAW